MSRVATLLRSAVCALGLALLVVGCGGEAQLKLSENSHQIAHSGGLGTRRLLEAPVSRPLAEAPDHCTATETGVGSSSVAYAALVTKIAVIRKTPQSRSPVIDRLGRLDANGFREVLGVIGVHSSGHCAPDWYRVQLSGPPNGLTGWVRSWAVRTYRVHSRIVVDLSERRLRLYRSGRLALESAVTVGASATPTPLGRYFVNERYVLPDSSGPFGPNALGISAHSDVLQHVWVQDGPIGIHGTNEPGSIGQAASHGCIRLVNDVMRRLFPLAPAGTPVIVKA
jgi:lipoprotein-anchoring transpeptidase ErfK/SrfK